MPLRQSFRILLQTLCFVLLSSFSTPAFDGTILAPPGSILCGYMRLKEGFSLLTGSEQNSSGRVPLKFQDFFLEIMKGIRTLKPSERESQKAGFMTEEKATVAHFWEALSEFSHKKEFQPEGVFFFLKNESEWVLGCAGRVSPQEWREVFREGNVVSRLDGFSVIEHSANLSCDHALHVGNNYCFVCPSGFEGNVIDLIAEGKNANLDAWPTFRSMLRENPIVALEMDVEELVQIAQKHEIIIPFPLDSIKIFRLMASGKGIKMQAYAPNDGNREPLVQMTKSTIENLKAVMEKVIRKGPASESMPLLFSPENIQKSLRYSLKGKSLYIQCEGGENAAMAQIAGIGMVSAFFFPNFEKARILAQKGEPKGTLPESRKKTIN